MTLLSVLLEQFGGYAIGAAALLSGLLGFGWHQRQAGAAAERNKQTVQAVKDTETRHAIEDAVRCDSGAVPSRLHDWDRD